jgi:hypothetical protein
METELVGCSGGVDTETDLASVGVLCFALPLFRGWLVTLEIEYSAMD